MKKGITLITLTVVITVMLILTTTITITSVNAMNNSKKMKFASELLFMQETIDNYKDLHEGNLPIKGAEITNENLPSDEYYEIDMSLLGLIETTYGRNLNNDINDIYVVSKSDNTVYYLKGLKIGNDIYYNLNDELKRIINYTDTRISSKDGIIFTSSDLNYTNKEITVKVQIPLEYSEVSVLSQNIQITDFSTEGNYAVFTISKSDNFDVIVNYNKGEGILKQVYTVSNFDNEAPIIDIKDITTLTDNNEIKTSITINTSDNLSGISKIFYEVDNVEKSYFEKESKGKEVINNNVIVDKYTKYITFYIVDKAGNSQILLETLNPTVTEDDYVKYGLILHYDSINNTGNGHSSTTTTWKDLSGNDNTGILYNFDSTQTSGWNGNYLTLDGVDDYVLLNNTLENIQNFTIEYVMTQKRYYSWEFLWGIKSNYFGMESGSSGYRYFYHYYNDSRHIISINDAMGNLNEPVNNTVVYNNNMVSAYKNGELVVDNQKISERISTSGTNFGIGADSNGNYKSKVDYYSFRIYNRALTSDEIKQNYDIDKIRFGI